VALAKIIAVLRGTITHTVRQFEEFASWCSKNPGHAAALGILLGVILFVVGTIIEIALTYMSSSSSASVTQQLVTSASTRATPAAEQQVGAAVASIAKGASEGDMLQQKAFDLLKENKSAEAAALLHEYAVEQTKEIAKNTKNVAMAWRNLGAIAGLNDPKRALDAYKEALKFDQDDVASLYGSGEILSNRGDLPNAEKQFSRVVALTKESDPPHVWALVGLADINASRGDLPAALALYRDSLSIAKKLGQASDLGDVQHQRQVMAINNRIGDVLVAEGNLDDALAAYRLALDISARLARETRADNKNPFAQRDLSVADNKIGDVLLERGDLRDAEEWYQAGTAIAIQNARTYTGLNDVLVQHDLWASYMKCGRVRERQGDHFGAAKFFNQSISIIRKLVDTDTEDRQASHDLMASYIDMGKTFLSEWNLQGAQKYFDAALSIANSLIRADPDNAFWQHDFTVASQQMGDVLGPQGKLQDALEQYHQDTNILEQLTKRDPGHDVWQQDLWLSYQRVGNTLHLMGKIPDAVIAYSSALNLAERRSADGNRAEVWMHSQAASLAAIGDAYMAPTETIDVHLAKDAIEDADSRYRRAFDLFNYLVSADPKDLNLKRDVSVLYSKIGQVREYQNNPVGAIKSFNVGLDIAKELAKKDTTNADWQRNVMAIYNDIGNLLIKENDIPSAFARYSAALTIAAKLASGDPANLDWQRDLSISDNKIGDALMAVRQPRAARDWYLAAEVIAGRLTSADPSNAIWQSDLAACKSRLAVTNGNSAP
jgi:tetratricopeptide (TPR) repeat protein